MPTQKDPAATVNETAPPKRARPPAKRVPKEVTADAVIARYPAQWILMRVTKWGERAEPERGYLLAHGRSRKKIDKARLEAVRVLEPLPGTLYVFEAYPPIRTHEEWLAALQRLAEEYEGDPFDLRPTASLGLVELDADGTPHLAKARGALCRLSQRDKHHSG